MTFIVISNLSRIDLKKNFATLKYKAGGSIRSLKILFKFDI